VKKYRMLAQDEQQNVHTDRQVSTSYALIIIIIIIISTLDAHENGRPVSCLL